MLYWFYELHRMALLPSNQFAKMLSFSMQHPFNPATYTNSGRMFSAAAEVFEHATRRYGKPAFGLPETIIDGQKVKVTEEVLVKRTYADLLHFKRDTSRTDPKLLIVAPMSGHFATLLRGTVETLLPDHDVYITDWVDAKQVPITADRFNLSDYIDYVIDFLHYIGPNTHVLAVCQPSVPVMAAVSIMGSWSDACLPPSMTLIGGPIDTRNSPTAVNKLAKEHDLAWFEKHVITTVPPPYPGMGRKVYPGFVQLTNFMAMNLEKHLAAHNEIFDHLVKGDDDAAEKKKAFYEEYRAVMDLPAEFYLQTIEVVFQQHKLPKGEMMARWQPVKPDKISRTAILCIEGELDDISGIGQTKAALDITTSLDADKKEYHLQSGAGHYGVFNGSKWRKEIAPKMTAFIRQHDFELGGKVSIRATVPPAAPPAAQPAAPPAAPVAVVEPAVAEVVVVEPPEAPVAAASVEAAPTPAKKPPARRTTKTPPRDA